MLALHIALEDGFQNHTVTIELDGRQVYSRSGVTTDLRFSRADALMVKLAAVSAQLRVSVEPGGLQASVLVDVLATPYLGISRDPSLGIVFTPSSDMPRYL